ncbi:N-acetylglucosamine kinase [Streptomyces spectabilis]|uniref:ATPase n=1 Tax=Streptomyces spectabilis TaxID=68270 RepID=A0A5P2X4X8_STRST|nr:BadF/BadG/BcrA/BcrD ATPase family protein [Streptomyces spectabilis]MBB5106167.1 N-acetylglucosamine kinase-like BadF-type ATPase [Streptomyces spectabilis]MCI3902782.1 ATPase [Streptomyces spectabilis]QEV60077.1 ATPase [Streptomyces spectabilis]GGV44951.1 kinase [Streptomyces spectabilis]
MGLSPVLAIDAGNSKTDVAVVAADGSVVGTARGGGFRPPQVGVEPAVDVLADAVGRALDEAGLTSVGHVSACLANADLPVEERELAAALRRRAWGTSVDVRNDTFAVLRAGLVEDAEPRGVAVVCGAGVNCVGMLPDGRTARFPAIGKISGDWGGGGGLAQEALWHAARAEDGRGGPTALMRDLPAHFGLDSMYALIEALHLEHIEAARQHELTPVLFAAAAAGDAVAGALVDRMADEIVAMATVALARLDLLEEEAPVLLGGSVLAARHRRLDDGVRVRLAERAPKAVPRVVTARPVLGAALLALDTTSAPPTSYARLRHHYTA